MVVNTNFKNSIGNNETAGRMAKSSFLLPMVEQNNNQFRLIESAERKTYPKMENFMLNLLKTNTSFLTRN